jgi:alpha-ketoglutarate-dependent taurine dioxygenase
VQFTWEKGDVLMVDNMLTAHSRRPFLGERKILVGMAEPLRGRE